MKILRFGLLALISACCLAAFASSREVSLAIEDAAVRMVAALGQDSRLGDIKSIAFVRLNLPEGVGKLALDSNDLQVFETTLVSKSGPFAFVTHAGHAEEWKLIDGVFNQASDFDDYDPSTHPEVRQFKLADALLFGQVIDCQAEETKGSSVTSVRIAMRLLNVSTGELIWGEVVEGKHTITFTDKTMGLITFRSIMFAVGGIVVLLLLVLAIRPMIRVR